MLYPTLRTERAPNIWDDVFSVRNQFDRMLDRWMTGRSGGEFAGWMPVVDVRETADEILIQAELPGLTPDDVDVQVENGVLTITGEKKHEVEEGKQDSSYHLVERRYGRFERSFALPRTVNPDDVQARFDNGVLTVTFPKSETAKPRRIEIQAGNSGKARLGSK